MINDFVYYNPVRVYFGNNQFENLPDVLNEYGNRILLVYGGKSIKNTGLYDSLQQYLTAFSVFELSGIEPNPDIDSVREGAKLCKDNKIDAILAVGGGSVVDAAKWIAAAAYVEHDAWDFFCRKTSIEKALPLITIITIAATGSEMNHGGVISNRAEVRKVGRSSPLLFPKASFLNPELTYTVNGYQTVCGSVDILSHVMELYFHNQGSMEMMDSMMESIMKTVVKYGAVAFDEPTNYMARANLMWSASWAINGFLNVGIRQEWTCHTIEHELSAEYGITHGHGMAILIPRWLRYCYSDDRSMKYRNFAVNVMGLPTNMTDKELMERSIQMIEELFFGKFRLESSLKSFGITEDGLKKIAEKSSAAGSIKGFAELYTDDIYKILLSCY